MTEPIRIFIGYDRRIPVAFQTLVHSITARATAPVTFCPISLTNLGNLYRREVNPLQSTEFSFSRFFTPYLSNYEGWSIFMDNDIIAVDDIAKLWALRDDKYAAMVCKHEHDPGEAEKFMHATQTRYEKKNWSSVILFNNAKCKALTPEYVNTATGLQLHQFKWLENDNLIGSLPLEWNTLVDYNHFKNPSMLHYTEGGPFYPDYKDCGYSEEWFREYAAANNCKEADVFQLTSTAKNKLRREG